MQLKIEYTSTWLMRRLVLVSHFALLIFISLRSYSLSSSQAFPPELEEDLSSGATAIYHLDFQSAETHFQNAIRLRPDHPAAYFFQVMLSWYRLTYDSLMKRDPAAEKLMLEQAERTMEKAKAYTKNPQTEAVGYLYWGGALGAKGWYHFSRNQWVRAYLSGKKGYNYLQKVVELDPEIYDAYLGIGVYEYYAATLGPVLKALSSFLVKGDKENAVRYLRLAEIKGRYVRLESSYFQWNAALDEQRLGDAFARIEILNQSFPNSPLFKWCEIQTLFYQRRWTEVIRRGQEYVALANAAPQPEHYMSPYSKLLSKVLYHCGASAFNMNDVHLAKRYFDMTIDQPTEFEGWKALAYLRRGELFDVEGKRTDALGKYRTVMKLSDSWNTHRIAKDRMKRPFTKDDLSRNGMIYSPLELWKAELK